VPRPVPTRSASLDDLHDLYDSIRMMTCMTWHGRSYKPISKTLLLQSLKKQSEAQMPTTWLFSRHSRHMHNSCSLQTRSR
jgi:hypothetical protein